MLRRIMNYFKDIIEEESKKEYYQKLHSFIENEYNTRVEKNGEVFL